MVFTVAILVLFPLESGVIGNKNIQLGLDLQGGLHLVYKADLSHVEAGTEDEIMNGVASVISNRVNPLGVSEPLIERQGEDRIVVELPGLDIDDTQKNRIGRTALLEFREQINGEWIAATGEIDGEEKVLTSSYFKENTYVTANQQGQIFLIFEFNTDGAKLSEQITSRLIGQPLGIYEGNEPLLGDDDQPIAPIVNSIITSSGQIEGLSLNEAQTLSAQLNAGRLPVSLDVIYEQTVSPSLGADFVELAVMAGIIGIILVMFFMIMFYRFPGFVASLALIFFSAIVLALFKWIPVTLTLAGIGGFILSLGMAVDANVLIFERIKEELRSGRTVKASIEIGFKRAWTAIWDSNVTTIIACIVLFWIGSSVAAGAAVRGFALTLGIGVAMSMLTAIVTTRTFLRVFVSNRLVQRKSLFTPKTWDNDV
jgi:preprotein translocase subunit SecD